MILKYGFMNYDEPNANGIGVERPVKFYEFNLRDDRDLRNAIFPFSERIYENLDGKSKFRFYIEGGMGKPTVSTYQVDLNMDSRSFFEKELLDDIRTITKTSSKYD